MRKNKLILTACVCVTLVATNSLTYTITRDITSHITLDKIYNEKFKIGKITPMMNISASVLWSFIFKGTVLRDKSKILDGSNEEEWIYEIPLALGIKTAKDCKSQDGMAECIRLGYEINDNPSKYKDALMSMIDMQNIEMQNIIKQN